MVSEDCISDSSNEEYVSESSADDSSSSEDHSSNLSEDHVSDSEFYGGIYEEPGSNFNSFEQLYRCYPVSFINKEHLEKGDKIVMPPSALDRLVSNLQVDYPMLFELSNPGNSGRVAHCGVSEFVADEGLMYLPYWMMKKLLLQEGDIVREYYIDVIETNPSPAICIIDTDCEVDFAPPLDYVEPQKPAVPSTQSKKRSREAEREEEPPEKIPKFSPFTGSVRRLDGKPALDQPVAPVSSPGILKQNQLESENGTKGSMLSTSVSAHRPKGKLVFGTNGLSANHPTNETPKFVPQKSSQEQSQKAEKPKLQAFTGKKYTLQG
ncbi:hypothetical protein DVH24_029356 [Malus domestica]|uniref:Ubiquitin fusion degradation protein UFD1 N-terminal subdomain 1 domain-containing protein n=1 Tax=Malus domestica TaxID=3750 RepID=A0A498HYI3_MALDO|nr:hypothetical protein DVH24_029356 [Malus domestica]